MRRCDAPSQRKAAGFRPLVPLARGTAALVEPSAASPVPLPTPHADGQGASAGAGRQVGTAGSGFVPPRLHGGLLGVVRAAPPLAQEQGKRKPEADSVSGIARQPSRDTSSAADMLQGSDHDQRLGPAQHRHAGFALAVKQPLPSAAREPAPAEGSEDLASYWEVFFTKQSKKKHKIWEDGVVVIKTGGMELQREEGSLVTKSKVGQKRLDVGAMIYMGSFEVKIFFPHIKSARLQFLSSIPRDGNCAHECCAAICSFWQTDALCALAARNREEHNRRAVHEKRPRVHGLEQLFFG